MQRVLSKYYLHLFTLGLFSFLFVTQEVNSFDAKDFQTAIGDVQDVNEHAKPDGSEEIEMSKHSKERSVPHFNTHLVWGDQLFEGCLLLDRKDQELLSKPIDPQTSDKKTYISYEEKLWPSNEIPYEIVSTLSHEKSNALFRNAISAAMKTIGESSCVKFRPKTESDRNWLNFFTGSGCWSGLGRKFWTSEPTYISLGKGCWKEPIVLHHIFHAMGFFHEQNRPDRDDYVRVSWENIINSKLYKFKRHHLYHEKMFAKDYDFKSIMHFHRFSYTKNPSLMTINANHNPHLVLGGEKLSKLDLERLNKMFCNGKPIVIPEEEEDNRVPSWGEWSSCSRECGIGHRFRREKCKKEYCGNLKHEMQACRLKLCSFSKYETNFEGGMNMWSSPKSYSGACVWKLFVSNRGGFTDHTTSHGNFVMVDWRDDGCRKHTTVKLESSKIEKNTRWKCLNFFYYMQGEAVGDLIVRMLYNNGASSEVWTRSGSQGNDWKQGAVSLPLTSYEYQIIFEYKVDSKAAYILLDDIYIDDGKCITGMQKCVDTDSRCFSWSEAGECYMNPAWMRRACCKSCSSQDECIDLDDTNLCLKTAIANDGCTKKDIKSHWKRCCKSCYDCLDKNPSCSKWQKEGECKKNPNWMLKNCKKSCQVCQKVI